MRSLLRIATLASLIVALPFPTFAADARAPAARVPGTPFLRVFSRDDYRASPVNWHVLAHANGLIYVGNNFGILEFDGVAWRRVPFPVATRYPQDALVADAAGKIWVSYRGGLYAIPPTTDGSAQAAAATDRLGAGKREFDALPHVVATPEGVCVAAPRELFLLPATGSPRSIATPADIESIWWMDGALHVLQQGGTVARVSGSELVPIAGAPAAFPDVFAARADASNAQRWRLLTARGPLVWDGRTLQPVSADSAAFFADKIVRCAAFLADGRMAFGTLRKGLLIVNADGTLDRQLTRAHGLPSDRVNGLAEDREGGLWLALQNGLVRAQLGAPYYTHRFDGSYDGSIRTIVRHDGRLYLGHAEGISAEDATGRFQPLVGLPDDTNGAIMLASGGGRLFAAASGLREIGPRDELRLIHAPDYTSVLVPARFPGWLCAGGGKGLWLFSEYGSGGPPRQLQGVTMPLVRLLDTGDGFVWGSTTDGRVWCADFRGGVRADAPVTFFGPGEGLPPTERADFTQLFQLGRDVVASCERYLLRFDAAAGRFGPETRIRGLPDKRPHLIEPAGDGTYWMQCGNGGATASGSFLFHVVPAAGGWEAVPFPTGPLNRVIVNSLFADSATQTLWLGTQSGLLSLDMRGKRAGALVPFAAILRKAETTHGRSVLAAAAGHPGATLAPAENSVRFEFAAPSYVHDHAGRTQTVFRTRLDGFDKEWTDWSPDTARAFTNLPGRRYVFHVQARNLEGRESTVASLAFAVRPRWWFTPWAWLGYAAVGCTMMMGIVRFRTGALRRKTAKLEALVAQRTQDLQAQNRELARLHKLELDEKITARLAEEKARLEVLRYQLNPHFLFNSLASIRAQIPTQFEGARASVERLADFCRLTLDGRRPDERTTLGEELTLLRAYLDIEQTRLGELLRVDFDCDPATRTALLPRLLLLPLVENALKYGQATSPDRLHLRLTTRRHGDDLEIEVANTGEWVDRPAARGLPSLGIGHENLRERLRRHYPHAHEFTHTAADGWVCVRLRLRGPSRHAGERPAS